MSLGIRMASWSAVGALVGMIIISGRSFAGTTPMTTKRVASGLSAPLYVTAPPGDTSRVFIVEQGSAMTGRIKILNLATGTVNAAPFISITPIATGGERGLLGLAFHPDYAANGYFYVNFTNTAGATVIQRYTVSADPDVADPSTALQILTIAQPFSNHNGGWISFGPDGYLYAAMGDGGSANDPGNRAQNPQMLLGKMLRLDVNGDDFPADPARNYAIPPSNPFVGLAPLDEIWSLGLRNPWRCSFDRLTGDLYVGDVGQGAWEEIDFEPATSAGGLNFGWRCMEGLHCTGLTGCTCNAPTLTLPIHEFAHAAGNCSVTGGYVYRGCAMPDMHGTYFFADYCSEQIWSFKYAGGNVAEFTNRTAELDPPSFTIDSITSFGEDAQGEIYICDQGGEVFKIIPATPPADSDGDGVVDTCDACVNNPDPECVSCPSDLDSDGTVGGEEVTIVLGAWGQCEGCAADLNGDDVVDGEEIAILLGSWGACAK